MNIEHYISNFIQNQFPDFYKEDGPLFIEFVKAYYEWLEQENNEIYETRRFLDRQDIDKTTDDFLEYFQRKYLFGIPEETLVNKRLLIKHIKDIYRATGSIRGWKLLFRILFNEDVEVYFPYSDVLTPSEGSWYEPKYLEVTYSENIKTYIGKTIKGISSGVTAVVESIIEQPINSNIRYTVYLTSITPEGADFYIGEKIALPEEIGNANINKCPTIIGSLKSVEITSGGQNFSVGNILRIVDTDPVTNKNLTLGIGGELRVSETWRGIGSIFYEIQNKGSGYSYTPKKIQYKGSTDTTGKNASFDLGPLIDIIYYTINTDLLIDYADVPLNGTYNFPISPTADKDTIIGVALQYVTQPYGSIASLTNISTGNSYTDELKIYVREGISTKNLQGNVSFTTNTNIVTGTNTLFSTYVSNNQMIRIGNTITYQDHIVESVSNNTQLVLQGPITIPTMSNTKYKTYINPFLANFGDEGLYDQFGNKKGENANITGIPSVGEGIIAEVTARDSGTGYTENEDIKMYLNNPVTLPIIVSGGTNYANGDSLIFSGGGTSYPAKGTVLTSNTGAITSVVMTSYGSSYENIPIISIKTRKGAGASLTTTIGQYNTYTIVTGKAKLGGLGTGTGRFLSTKSFLNADKYLHDSNFYQTYSYQLKSAINFNKYKEILSTIYHISGYEMFGESYKVSKEKSKQQILFEQNTAIIG